MVFLNDMERDNYIITLTAMCEQLAKKVAEYENRQIEDVISDAYLDSGCDLWHESFKTVLSKSTGTYNDE